MNLDDNFEPVIGLEVHAQMLTASKAFCSCSTGFGNEPNSNVCPVCLGMPGTLPVLNFNLVDFVLRIGLATHCRIEPRSVFARKNYFYPDLPKGYQISQFERPICTGGHVEIDLEDGTRKRIGLTRIHMEEDAGKSIHDMGLETLVDANRCGVPLIEIVSEPDIRSPREAYLYLNRIRQLVTYLAICDGNMEEGSLRCDANVSVRRKGEKKFGTKTEVKNMNSFRYLERALEFEINRQVDVIKNGGTVLQETLFWDANLGAAIPMRSKEEAHDYRYFPDPDLVPVVVDQEWIEKVRKTLPELPVPRRDRYAKELGLPLYDSDIITSDKGIADYFEGALNSLALKLGTSQQELAKTVSNWVMNDVLRVLSERKMDIRDFPISPSRLGSMIQLVLNGTISGTIARELFEQMLSDPGEPEQIVRSKGLLQVSDTGVLQQAIDAVLSASPEQVSKYMNGNEKVFGFLVGETMKRLKGKGNPKLINDLLRKSLATLKATT